MSNDWGEWSKYVLFSIDKIQAYLKSFEENINNLKIEINSLKDEKKNVERIELNLKNLEETYGNLKVNVAVQKVKLAFIIAGIVFFSSTVTSIITALVVKNYIM